MVVDRCVTAIAADAGTTNMSETINRKGASIIQIGEHDGF